ncbi:unnamed protein product [Amoebophrya sp. A25]|nr:unnamed protein product [Amoebophrya sp. A25]|eukprot:GSA25T00011995001.1
MSDTGQAAAAPSPNMAVVGSAREVPESARSASSSQPSARSSGRMRRTYSTPRIRCDRLPTHTIKAIPGYRGYLPGVKSETIGENIFSNVVYESQHATKRLGHSQSAQLYDRDQARAAQAGLLSIRVPEPTREQILKTLDNKRGDEDRVAGFAAAAGDYRESRVPDSYESYYEEPPLDNTLKAKTNIVGYGGHVPGREAENVHGNTWTRTNLNATSAFHRTFRGRNRNERSDPWAVTKGKSRLHPRGAYDMEQNRNQKFLYTKERTAVGRVETDTQEEVPLYNNSYNDMRRGWSLDPFVGKQIDAAGRQEPFTMQESYGCVRPFKALRAPGYTGFVPGKIGENIVAERQTMTDHIAVHRTNKNKSEKLQR